MKCITYNCTNKTHQERGEWLGSRWICTPCYTFLTTGEGHNSQILENKNKTSKASVIMSIYTEADSDPSSGEYGLTIDKIVSGHIDVMQDIKLLREAVANEVDFKTLPDDGYTIVHLEESGEWEDVFWHKYFIVKNIERVSL